MSTTATTPSPTAAPVAGADDAAASVAVAAIPSGLADPEMRIYLAFVGTILTVVGVLFGLPTVL